MREAIGSYKNGNYKVLIFSDGTKIRYNKEDTLIPSRPESFDIKITNRCQGSGSATGSSYVTDDGVRLGCPYCHEKSGPDGKHGDILNIPFLNSLEPYTELAIGGGNVLEHPDFIAFLIWCKKKNLIPSATFNQVHFEKNFELIKSLVEDKLLYGVGISLVYPTPEFIEKVKQIPNAVIHVIAGIVTESTLEPLYDKDFKMLILGYKQFGRGNDYYAKEQERVDTNIKWIKENIKNLSSHFKVISFDNLAIKQLDLKSIVSPEEWEQLYMGDDGQYTMYIDTVNHEYAVSSTSTIRYPYTDETITEMFNAIRKERGFDV